MCCRAIAWVRVAEKSFSLFSVSIVRGSELSWRFCHFISDRRVSSYLEETQPLRFGHMMHEAAIGTAKSLNNDDRTFGDMDVLRYVEIVA